MLEKENSWDKAENKSICFKSYLVQEIIFNFHFLSHEFSLDLKNQTSVKLYHHFASLPETNRRPRAVPHQKTRGKSYPRRIKGIGSKGQWAAISEKNKQEEKISERRLPKEYHNKRREVLYQVDCEQKIQKNALEAMSKERSKLWRAGTHGESSSKRGSYKFRRPKKDADVGRRGVNEVEGNV